MQDDDNDNGEKKEPPATRTMAVVQFFGDNAHETVPFSSCEGYENMFKRLYKKRYEKIFLRAVCLSCLHYMQKYGMTVQKLASRLDVSVFLLQAYLDDAAAEDEEIHDRARRRNSSSSTLSAAATAAGAATATTAAAPSAVAAEHEEKKQHHEDNYFISPELFKQTKRTGILTGICFY